MKESVQTLLPTKIDKSEASYKTVEDLNVILSRAEEKHVRNIALTGPFGSGKSSVLLTLREDFQNPQRHYLPISLAMLQADEDFNPFEIKKEEYDTGEGEDNIDKRTADNKQIGKIDDRDKRIENLNRKVEFSILQQLIYREKTKDVPNSRFRRIIHLDEGDIIRYSFGFLGFIIAFFCRL